MPQFAATRSIPSRGTRLATGMRHALPIVLGYVPIGFAYGVLGTAAGVPLWAIVAMSILLYAGSAQFIAVSLLDQGATAVTLIATIFLVNLRHILYGSALSPRLRHLPPTRLAWVAAEFTDESFVMASRAAGKGMPLSFPFMAGLNGVAQLSWICASFVGALAGSFVGDPLRFGLDYALVAMFLGLLALQIHRARDVVVALVAGGTALLFSLLGLSTAGVLIATLLASAAGLLVPAGRPPGGKE